MFALSQFSLFVIKGVLMKSCLRIIFAVLILAGSVSAELTSQFRTQSGISWRGLAQITRESRKVTVHEYYLEIEEEVELGAYAGSYGSPTESQQSGIELSGTFTLPKGSVLSGAVLWDGGNILKAKLKTKSATENEYADSAESGSDWKPSAGDPLMIALKSRDTVDTYAFNLFAIKWGEQRRLRIRYLQPVVYGIGENGTYIDLHAAFGSSVASRPAEFSLELRGTKTVTSIKVQNGASTMSYPLSETALAVIVPYRNDVRILRPELNSGAKMYSTRIDTGKLAGEYLHYFSSVPEELLKNAGLKREVVFLWRWENENSLVEWTNQNKYFTQYGWKALDQAHQITSVVSRLLDAQAGVALYHDRTEGSRDTVFSLCTKGSDDAQSLVSYLSYLTQNDGENILSDVSGYEVRNESEGDSLSAAQLDSICQAGFNDFEIAVTAIKTMFSTESKIVKHIVLLTAGKRKTDSNISFAKAISDLDGVTMSGYGIDSKYPDGYWPGVDMKSVLSTRKLTDGGEIISSIRVPRGRSANFSLYLKSTKQSKAFTVDGVTANGYTNYNTIAFTGHADQMWNDTVVWKAQDLQGTEIGSFIQVPLRQKSVNDTDQIMLWGGSASNPYSERIKSGSVGYLVGFVDESYSLLAMPYDSVSKEIQKQIEAGGDIANLSRDEIFGPITSLVAKSIKKGPGIHGITCISGAVRFALSTGSAASAELQIYDLKGRMVMRFSGDQLIGRSELLWDGTGFGGVQIGKGVYVARFALNGTVQASMKFTL